MGDLGQTKFCDKCTRFLQSVNEHELIATSSTFQKNLFNLSLGAVTFCTAQFCLLPHIFMSVVTILYLHSWSQRCLQHAYSAVGTGGKRMTRNVYCNSQQQDYRCPFGLR